MTRSKGCSHCCHMDVQITALEADYIYLATGIPHNPDAKLTINHKTSCPFLSNTGFCTIYDYRPLFCRTYHALSAPDLCGIKNAEITQYGSMGCDMGNIIYRGVMIWIHFQNQHATGGIIKDIRDFFPHDPDLMHRHMKRIVT